MMAHQGTHTEREYLNDFHRKWSEACMKENERVQSMRFSHEYAKLQSEHFAGRCQLNEEEYKKRRMQLLRAGQ